MKKLIQVLLLGGILLASSFSYAAISPVSVSILPPVQFPPEDFSVTGARVSLFWGRHRDVYGIDLSALGNITDQEFVGIAASGLFNVNHGMTHILGLQLAGLTNVGTQKTNVYGLQAALGVNYLGAASTVTGFQIAGLANVAAHTDIRGFQIGLYNRANNVYGFQIGLINVATSLKGIQIGLANFNYKGLFYVSPIINIGF